MTKEKAFSRAIPDVRLVDVVASKLGSTAL
jgi:hypothetical protein